MKSNIIQSLPFDTTLFGYSVAKFVVDGFWDQRIFLEQASDFELVYIFSKKPLQLNHDSIRLADIKLTYEKALFESSPKDPSILPYDGPLSVQLFDLAVESGIYSRFHTDHNFENEEFEKLYRIWIKKAVDKHEVLVSNDLSGFISCTVKEITAQIGLIAVDKNQRGKGLAKRLIHAAEREAFLEGAQILTVATQEMNIPASKLYESLGFGLIERMYIYHFWNRES